MSSISPFEIQQVKCEKAAQIMAEMAVWALHDSESSDEKATEIISCYALACALASDGDDFDFEYYLFGGLIDAGYKDEEAAQLADTIADLPTMRYIFSLSFLGEDQQDFGLRVGVRNRWLEPNKFIDSILKLDNR